MKITLNLDEESDPFVDGVSREVVLGGAHRIVAPRVLEHQAVPMLKWLPLGEPGHCEVLPRQAFLRQLADPPNCASQQRRLGKMRTLRPGRSLAGGAVLEGRQRPFARRVGEVLQVEEASGPVPRGFVAVGGRIDATGAEHESDGPASGQLGGLWDLLLFDGELVLKERKFRKYPEMALTKRDMIADGQDTVWGYVVGLEPIRL